MSNCVDSSEWQEQECDIKGHEGEDCSRLVCPTCGDTMYRKCEEEDYL